MHALGSEPGLLLGNLEFEIRKKCSHIEIHEITFGNWIKNSKGTSKVILNFPEDIKSTQSKEYSIGHKKTTTNYLKSVVNAKKPKCSNQLVQMFLFILCWNLAYTS